MEIKRYFIHPRQLEQALKDVHLGNLKSGPLVLRYIVQCVDSGEVPDGRAMVFFASALEKSLSAYHTGHRYDLNEALGLLYSQKRPDMREFGKVHYAVKYGEEVVELMESGESYNNAIAKIAANHKKSGTTIKYCYARLKRMNRNPTKD